jgi:hypothetical protein
LENWIKNVKGQSTLSEVAPEYFGTKRCLSLKNENIMCDRTLVRTFWLVKSAGKTDLVF